MAVWYNESMVGAVVSGLSMERNQGPNRFHGRRSWRPCSQYFGCCQAGGSIGCAHDDGGETVDYTVELMVLDYTIAPYLDTSDL